MKTIKKLYFGKIEINFQYENQFVTLKVEPFKTLYELKEMAVKKMILVPLAEVSCFYSGIDMSKDEDKKIGDLFKHRGKITITLKKNSKQKIFKSNSLAIFSSSTSRKNINNMQNCNENSNSVITKDRNFLKKKLIINNNKKLNKTIIKNIIKKPYSINSVKNKNSINNFNSISNNQSNKNSNNDINNLPKTERNINKKKRLTKVFPKILHSKFSLNRSDDLCDCGKLTISYFCRTCGKFLCYECKLNKIHNEHLILHLDMENLENNINLYSDLMKNETQKILDLNNIIINNENQIIGNDILNKENNDIQNKYQEITNSYLGITQKIKKYLEKQELSKVKILVSAYNSTAVKIHKEIYDLIEELKSKYDDKNAKCVNFNEIEDYFYQIKNKEEILDMFNRDIIKYHLTNKINSKIKNTFDNITSILDEILNDEKPFNLDDDFLEELLKMNIVLNVGEEEKENEEGIDEHETENES